MTNKTLRIMAFPGRDQSRRTLPAPRAAGEAERDAGHARPDGRSGRAALLAALDLTRPPPMPAPLARLLQRHDAEAVDRRFAAAALTLAETAEMIAALA